MQSDSELAATTNTCFTSRQLNVPEWNEEGIANTVAMVLGAGGIGTNVCLMLCRLGVKKILVFDNDVVDASNLNRQVLFSTSDVGAPKVVAAAESMKKNHSFRTDVEAYNMDVVAEWGRVVDLATKEQVSVVFNGVDVGALFDVAVGSMCAALDIPYVAGSSYAHTAIVDYFKRERHGSEGTEDQPCPQCAGMADSTAPSLKELHISKILSHRTLTGLVTSDAKPTTEKIGSYVMVCNLAGNAMVSTWMKGSLLRQGPSGLGDHPQSGEAPAIVTHTWAKYDVLDPASLVQFSVERNPDCPICSSC